MRTGCPRFDGCENWLSVSSFVILYNELKDADRNTKLEICHIKAVRKKRSAKISSDQF